MENAPIILYRGGQGEYVEKKSRFIANLFPVKTEEEALEKIAEMRKKYYDARHNCFAYVLGENNETERCSDDGEPSGTAGRPMLEVLTGQGVHDALAVVTRYFGGTLLGTGGLVRAYTAAVKEGLADCVLMEQNTGHKLGIKTDYNEIGKLQHLARTWELIELEASYADTVELTLLVPENQIEKVEQEITEKTAGRAGLERSEKLRYGVVDGQVILLA
ncbi:MAG: YigZ family protein [Lachnospiraceae bacterium]|nr:YigZ family protein [Lachnospiraceae bacterium]